MDTVAGLQLIIRIVETGSFSKASVDVGITQPTATKHVAALESRLGARLFHRSTRGVTPTEVGALYYEKCKLIAREIEDADSLAGLLQTGVSGVLRINSSVAFGRRVLTPLVLDFMRQHPGLQVELGFEDRYVNLVELGIDVAVRMGRLPDSTLGARYLGVNPWVLVASPAYLQDHGTPTATATARSTSRSLTPFAPCRSSPSSSDQRSSSRRARASSSRCNGLDKMRFTPASAARWASNAPP
jgi:DNA-binding transcriptional LysR family regulator